MTPMPAVIAIDGAAGSGKSTLARALAVELDLPYVNTGLMYRAVALKARLKGVSRDDAPALANVAVETRFELDSSVRPAELTIDGEPPAAELTSPEVESTVSSVARHPEVRAVLRDVQRRLAEGGGVVEGRDIGTVVVPEAGLKVFLQAHADERADRRALEREDDPASVAEALGTRDELDARTNPLVPASDAIVIDTTGLEPGDVLARAVALARERGIGS
jgi:cytidylate kinase